MSILDMLLTNHDMIGKGFEVLTKGSKYLVAYTEDNTVLAYTTGIDVGKNLMEQYLSISGQSELPVSFVEEFHKTKDDFFTENEALQICIVDKDIMLRKDVDALMQSVELVPDKNNKRMVGLDKFTRKV